MQIYSLTQSGFHPLTHNYTASHHLTLLNLGCPSLVEQPRNDQHTNTQSSRARESFGRTERNSQSKTKPNNSPPVASPSTHQPTQIVVVNQMHIMEATPRKHWSRPYPVAYRTSRRLSRVNDGHPHVVSDAKRICWSPVREFLSFADEDARLIVNCV